MRKKPFKRKKVFKYRDKPIWQCYGWQKEWCLYSKLDLFNLSHGSYRWPVCKTYYFY